MTDISVGLKYLKSHEWVKLEANNVVVIGITEHAQKQLGDVVFIELPEVKSYLAAGEEAGVIESVKAASEFYSPITGEIIAINDALEDAPEIVNNDPYNKGWLFKIRLSNKAELEGLMGENDYAEYIKNT